MALFPSSYSSAWRLMTFGNGIDRYILWDTVPPEGHSTFFQVGVCGRISKVWSLRTDICLWKEGFVSWKFPNLGACELKISKFGGLWAKIWVKIEAVEAKISKFSQRGSCELTLLLAMGPLRAAGEAWKGGFQGRASPYPLSRSVPPPGLCLVDEVNSLSKHFPDHYCWILILWTS